MKFLVWLPGWGETEEYAREVEAWDAEMAAEEFVEKHWSDCDYVDEQEVAVKDGEGVIVEYTVVAEPTVNFRAYPKRSH